MLLLPPGSTILHGPLDLTAQLLPKQNALLLDYTQLGVLRGIGSWLSPVYFQGPRPRWVSCYAFFKGWLLLSLPPHCLWLRTPFYLTLSQHLGTLASVWVASLSVWDLTPQCPSPGIYGADRFGVREEGEPFRVLVF